MDPSLLSKREFWDDPAPFAAGDFPGEIPAGEELVGHVVFETSGSSGVPKWIALSKTALLASAAAVNRHLEVGQASCWGLALPPRHVGGFGVAARAFHAGCRFAHFGQRWEAHAFRTWLEQERVSHVSLVPTQIHDLTTKGLRAPAGLRAVVVGGGQLDVGSGRTARELGWPVLASYGMTEAGSQIATQGLESLAAPYQPAPIPLLPIWRAELSPEKRLRISGPALFTGMLVPEKGTWLFKPRLTAWFETADRVALEDKLLTPLGRVDLMVKVLGELVDLEMIERELSVMSAGRLAPGMFAVVALPDTRAEHVLVPVFDSEVNATVIRDVLTAYAARAPGFRRLGPVVMLEHFHRSPLGKPCRAGIAAEITAHGRNI